MFLYNKSKHFSGWANRYFGYKRNTVGYAPWGFLAFWQPALQRIAPPRCWDRLWSCVEAVLSAPRPQRPLSGGSAPQTQSRCPQTRATYIIGEQWFWCFCFLGYFDPVNIFSDNKNKWFSGWPKPRCLLSDRSVYCWVAVPHRHSHDARKRVQHT